MSNIVDFEEKKRHSHTVRSLAKEFRSNPESVLQLLRESGINKKSPSDKVSDRERTFAYEYIRNNTNKKPTKTNPAKTKTIEVQPKRRRNMPVREEIAILNELKKLAINCVEKNEIFGASDLPERFSELPRTDIVRSLCLIDELRNRRDDVKLGVQLLREILSTLGMNVVLDFDGQLSYKGPSKLDNISSIEDAFFAICSLPKSQLNSLVNSYPEASNALLITLCQLRPPRWPENWQDT